VSNTAFLARLSATERNTCLAVYRRDRFARQALVLLLLADGRSYREIGVSALVAEPFKVEVEWIKVVRAEAK
jgi:hypothetical protein